MNHQLITIKSSFEQPLVFLEIKVKTMTKGRIEHIYYCISLEKNEKEKLKNKEISFSDLHEILASKIVLSEVLQENIVSIFLIDNTKNTKVQITITKKEKTNG